MILKNEVRMKFIIPVGKIDRKKAMKSLVDIISGYKMNIFWNHFERQTKLQKILKLI